MPQVHFSKPMICFLHNVGATTLVLCTLPHQAGLSYTRFPLIHGVSREISTNS